MKLRSLFEIVLWTIIGSLFFLLLLLPAQILFFLSVTQTFSYITIFLAISLVLFSILCFQEVLDLSDDVLKIILGSDVTITLFITVLPNDIQVQLSLIAKLMFIFSIVMGLVCIVFRKEYKSLRIRHAFAILCISYSIYALMVLIQTWVAPLIETTNIALRNL